MGLYLVDVFAEEALEGNQLPVLVPEDGSILTEREMQRIAQEMHMTETAFVLSGRQSDGSYRVRIFTPLKEERFATHPVLGAAYVIRTVLEGGKADRVLLDLPVGPILVTFDGDRATMVHNQPVFGMTIAHLPSIIDAIGIREEDLDTDRPIQWVSTGLPSVIVPLRTIDAVERCVISQVGLNRFLLNYGGGNVLVFAPEEGKEQTLWVRAFLDAPGLPEDPAAGSGAGNLAAYLLHHGFYGSRIEPVMVPCFGPERPSRLEVSGSLTDGRYDICVSGTVRMIAKGNWL